MNNMNKKSHTDWLRACANLPPRPMDLEDKAVLIACGIAIVILSIILIWG